MVPCWRWEQKQRRRRRERKEEGQQAQLVSHAYLGVMTHQWWHLVSSTSASFHLSVWTCMVSPFLLPFSPPASWNPSSSLMFPISLEPPACLCSMERITLSHVLEDNHTRSSFFNSSYVMVKKTMLHIGKLWSLFAKYLFPSVKQGKCECRELHLLESLQINSKSCNEIRSTIMLSCHPFH